MGEKTGIDTSLPIIDCRPVVVVCRIARAAVYGFLRIIFSIFTYRKYSGTLSEKITSNHR